MKAKCAECDRVFDLLEETDSEEWFYGHDCEPKKRKCVTGRCKNRTTTTYNRNGICDRHYKRVEQ